MTLLERAILGSIDSIEQLEHIIQNDCLYMQCDKCPIKNECDKCICSCGGDVNRNIRKGIARKALNKIKIKELQRILYG
jgi:hypothetical protein